MTFKDRQRAADAAVARVQDVIDQASRDVDADELAGTFLIGCHLTPTGRDVVMQRGLMACEGSGETTEEVQGAFQGEILTEDAQGHIRKIALKQARAHLRTRAVRAAGEAQDPLWSYEGHVILGEIIRQSGLGPEIFAIRDVINWDAQRSLVPGDAIRMPWGVLSGHEHQVASGFISPIMTLGDDHRGVSINLDPENPSILIPEAYPQTVAQYAVGRTIMDVMPHPLFEALPPLRITRMATVSTMTVVNIEIINAPLAPAPPGVNTSWMKLPTYRP